MKESEQPPATLPDTVYMHGWEDRTEILNTVLYLITSILRNYIPVVSTFDIIDSMDATYLI